jgi:curli biogenesis system outer membrane secretion channel CsgG
MNKSFGLPLALASALALAGCATSNIAPPEESVALISGPAIEDIETPFDRALVCLAGKISPAATFSVGAIADSTGKEQFTEGGTGKFVTQGAGEIVQSALFNAGVTLLNRRDPRVLEAEVKWGIRQGKSILPSRYFVTGSVNSLDFIPGAGFDAQIAGVGPRYRQHRILVGLDLSVTETSSGRIVANSSMQKQIFADELGFGIGRFFGDVLVNLDAANLRREATSLALRQMLNLATYDLLTQLMKPESYSNCSEEIRAYHKVTISKTSKAASAAAVAGKLGANDSQEAKVRESGNGSLKPSGRGRGAESPEAAAVTKKQASEVEQEGITDLEWPSLEPSAAVPVRITQPNGSGATVASDPEVMIKKFDVR